MFKNIYFELCYELLNYHFDGFMFYLLCLQMVLFVNEYPPPFLLCCE